MARRRYTPKLNRLVCGVDRVAVVVRLHHMVLKSFGWGFRLQYPPDVASYFQREVWTVKRRFIN